MVAKPERRRCHADVLRARRHGQAAFAESILVAQQQREWITRLRVKQQLEQHAVSLVNDCAPRHEPHQTVDRVAGQRLRQRELQRLSIERVLAVLDAVRPGGEHLAPRRMAHLTRVVTIDHIASRDRV